MSEPDGSEQRAEPEASRIIAGKTVRCGTASRSGDDTGDSDVSAEQLNINVLFRSKGNIKARVSR